MDQDSGSEILAQSRPALDQRQAVAVFQPPGDGLRFHRSRVDLRCAAPIHLFVEVVSEARGSGACGEIPAKAMGWERRERSPGCGV